MEPPGFLRRNPPPERLQDPLDPETSTLILPEGPRPGPGTDGQQWPQPDPSPGPRAPGGDPGAERHAQETGRSFPASGSDPADFEPLLCSLLQVGGVAANARLEARHDRRNERWLMTSDDLAMIGGPLASIAARHAPAGSGSSNDMVDAITVGVGVTGYVLRNTLSAPAEPIDAELAG